ncbi:hypothetical protein QA597_10565 [Marinilabiliaceae bacterium ANBcel2]|nr:hypothetical protein [Marinilabiliaceae bacterium ANBcel2]
MKRTISLLALLVFISAPIIAQHGITSMKAQPMWRFYDACATRGYTREAVLEIYSTSFKHQGKQYMLSYDDNIIVGNGRQRLPWTQIHDEDIRIFSREIFIYKRRNDRWFKWSPPILQSVTNSSNFIEYGHAGNSFNLENGWIILELTQYIRTNYSSHSFPLFIYKKRAWRLLFRC